MLFNKDLYHLAKGTSTTATWLKIESIRASASSRGGTVYAVNPRFGYKAAGVDRICTRYSLLGGKSSRAKSQAEQDARSLEAQIKSPSGVMVFYSIDDPDTCWITVDYENALKIFFFITAFSLMVCGALWMHLSHHFFSQKRKPI
jgi:hypothetical protein